jgi:hypothetical protein
MIEPISSLISRVDTDAYFPASVRPAAEAPHPSAHAGQASEAEAPLLPEIPGAAEKMEAQQERLLPLTRSRSDVCLKFRVDKDTNAITVFVVDRASDRVLRCIPPDELQKLNAGDLVKLVA